LNERCRDFQITHKELLERAKVRYSDFKKNSDFNNHYKEWKVDPNCCQISYLDPIKKNRFNETSLRRTDMG